MNFKRIYGITLEDRKAILAQQGGKCAICGTTEFNGGGPCMDHDHETGKIRGVLCHNCNSLLGHAHDGIKVLEAAAAYLRRL